MYYTELAFDVGGQWFWEIAESGNGEIAHFVNPLNGFASGCTTWGDIQTCLTSTGYDLAFGMWSGDCPDPIDQVCSTADDDDYDGLTGCDDADCLLYIDCVAESYAEADDAGNNAVQWSWPGPATSAGPGTAEATGITLSGGSSYLFSGTAVDNGEAATTDNDDHDTFAFNMGDATDILVALDFTGAGNDLDVVITSTTAFFNCGPGQVGGGSSDTLDGDWEEWWIGSDQGCVLSAGTDYYITVAAFNQVSTSYPADYQLFILAN